MIATLINYKVVFFLRELNNVFVMQKKTNKKLNRYNFNIYNINMQ